MFAPPRRNSVLGKKEKQTAYKNNIMQSSSDEYHSFEHTLEKDLDRQRRENQMLISRLENIQRRRVEVLASKQTQSKNATDFDRGTMIPILVTMGESANNFAHHMVTDRKTSVFQAKELLHITMQTICECLSDHVNEDVRINNAYNQLLQATSLNQNSPSASPTRGKNNILANADAAKREGLPNSNSAYKTLKLEAKRFFQQKEQLKKTRLAKLKGAAAVGNYRSGQTAAEWKASQGVNERKNFPHEYAPSGSIGIKHSAFWWSNDEISPQYLEELRDKRDKKASFWKGVPKYDPEINYDSRVKGGGMHYVDQDDNFDEIQRISEERVRRRRERGEFTKSIIGVDCNAQNAYTFTTQTFKNWIQRRNGNPRVPAPGQNSKRDSLRAPKLYEKVQPVVVLPAGYDPNTRAFTDKHEDEFVNQPAWSTKATKKKVRTSVGVTVQGISGEKVVKEQAPKLKTHEELVDDFENRNATQPNWADQVPTQPSYPEPNTTKPWYSEQEKVNDDLFSDAVMHKNVVDGNHILKQPQLAFHGGDNWEEPLNYGGDNDIWGNTQNVVAPNWEM
eukprot:GDKJ01041820.1.p1 GENE.GDKJ01041820.1~~GDKJ01041820.1.p1  ORF type:complete len:563 (-),score=106.93 GDKJ01041820.1:119-1807(-)